MNAYILASRISSLRITGLVFCIVIGLILPTHAFAVIVNTLPVGVTVSPLPFSDVRSSDVSNVDIGNQSPANVEAKLESAAWFNTPLTFVGGGACGAFPTFANGCTGFENGSKGGTSNLAANVYGVHYGNNFIAVLYGQEIAGFDIDGLSNGVSNIYAFNSSTSVSQVPLPAALPLFLTAISMLGLAGWWRRRSSVA
jgi:hypothetical protein